MISLTKPKFWLAALALTPFVLSPVYAETNEVAMKGKIVAYYGQYNPGVTGETAYMKSLTEGNLGAKVTKGALTAYYEVEARENSTDSVTTVRYGQYKGSNYTARVGTCVPKESVNFAMGGQVTAQVGKVGGYTGLPSKTEADGLCGTMKLGEALTIGATQYEIDALNKASSDFTNGTGYMPGTSTQVGAQGKVGSFAYRVSTLSSTTDLHKDGHDTASHSNFHVGIKAGMGPLTIAADVNTKAIGSWSYTDSDGDGTNDKGVAGTSTTNTSDVALMGTLKMNGGSKIMALVANKTVKADTTGAKASSNAYTTVIYDAPIEKGAGLQFMYLANSSSSEDSSVTAVTKTFIGGGFYAKF